MPLFPQEGARSGDIPDFARIEKGDRPSIARAIRVLWDLALERSAEFDRTGRFGMWTPYTLPPPSGVVYFSATIGDWTVPTQFIETLEWELHRRTLTVAFSLGNTTVTTSGANLRLALPRGYVIKSTSYHPIRVVEPGPVVTTGLVVAAADAGHLDIRSNMGGAAFVSSFQATTVQGVVRIHVHSFSTGISPS